MSGSLKCKGFGATAFTGSPLYGSFASDDKKFELFIPNNSPANGVLYYSHDHSALNA